MTECKDKVNARQIKFYNNHRDKCVCTKILKNIKENGGSPTLKSLHKYPELLSMDAIFDNFKKYLQSEGADKEKKIDKFVNRIREYLNREE